MSGFWGHLRRRLTGRDLEEGSDARMEEFVHREAEERDGHEAAIQGIRERNAELLVTAGMPERAAVEETAAERKRELRRRLADDVALDVLRGE